MHKTSPRNGRREFVMESIAAVVQFYDGLSVVFDYDDGKYRLVLSKQRREHEYNTLKYMVEYYMIAFYSPHDVHPVPNSVEFFPAGVEYRRLVIDAMTIRMLDPTMRASTYSSIVDTWSIRRIAEMHFPPVMEYDLEKDALVPFSTRSELHARAVWRHPPKTEGE